MAMLFKSEKRIIGTNLIFRPVR